MAQMANHPNNRVKQWEVAPEHAARAQSVRLDTMGLGQEKIGEKETTGTNLVTHPLAIPWNTEELFRMTQRQLPDSCESIQTKGGKVKVTGKTGWGICFVALPGKQQSGVNGLSALLEPMCAWHCTETVVVGADVLVALSILWPPLLSWEYSRGRCTKGF